jgi:hypothetical protein
MNTPLCDGNPTKNGKGTCFNSLPEVALADQSSDLGMISSMDMMLMVSMGMAVLVLLINLLAVGMVMSLVIMLMI